MNCIPLRLTLGKDPIFIAGAENYVINEVLFLGLKYLMEHLVCMGFQFRAKGFKVSG